MNTLASQTAELIAVLVSGIVLLKIGTRMGFLIMFSISAVGSIILIFIVY